MTDQRKQIYNSIIISARDQRHKCSKKFDLVLKLISSFQLEAFIGYYEARDGSDDEAGGAQHPYH
jgi:hypothetical protein